MFVAKGSSFCCSVAELAAVGLNVVDLTANEMTPLELTVVLVYLLLLSFICLGCR
jgi:hypothetical protein